MDATTVQDARSELANTISFAQIALQGATPGTQAYIDTQNAIGDGQEALTWLADNAGMIPPSLADAPLTRDKIAGAIDNINAAVATIKKDPDGPLFKTIFPSSGGVPWGLIGAGAALLGAYWMVFKGGRRS